MYMGLGLETSGYVWIWIWIWTWMVEDIGGWRDSNEIKSKCNDKESRRGRNAKGVK